MGIITIFDFIATPLQYTSIISDMLFVCTCCHGNYRHLFCWSDLL